MATDPFSSIADSIGEPYEHAFGITPADLAQGDVELPAVSSAVWLPRGCHMQVTMVGGETVWLHAEYSRLLPIRIVRVHQTKDPDPASDLGWSYLDLPALVLW